MDKHYVVCNGELYHHGVKGMKWGVRRYQNSDGTLTPAGIKKYARRGYARDSFNSNTSAAGKAWDRFTGAHKIYADAKYKTSSKAQNKARAEQYLADKNTKKQSKSDSKPRLKDLEKEYGKLENQMTYGKNANKAKNAQLSKRMKTVEKQMSDARKEQREKGRIRAGKIIAGIGSLYVTDLMLTGGKTFNAIDRGVKKGVKTAGRAVITAYMKARGATYVRWYD